MTDFLAAFCVGISQVISGHPFDTAKVLIQNNKKWFGLSFKDYYRGWRFPLVSATLFNCTVFPIYERTLPYTNNSILSGFIAGIMVAPSVFCFEVGKIRQQTNQPLGIKHFLISRGRISTGVRESVAMASYFGMYHNCRENGWHPLVAGGAAGLTNWTTTYPIDVIKARQIAQNVTIKQAICQGNLWGGYSICAMRAVIVNAINFWIYDTVKEQWKNS